MNTIWITGEFFGVQRARDMLFQMHLNKVGTAVLLPVDASDAQNAGKAAHLTG